MQTWQKGSLSFHTHKMHRGCPPKSIRKLVSSQRVLRQIWGCGSSWETSEQQKRLSGGCQQQLGLLPHTCRGCMAYVGAVKLFSSAQVSCVCLEPRSSGVCRSNDTTTATGILAPRVEIRHFLCRKVGQQEKKKRETGLTARIYISEVVNRLDMNSHSQTPEMHHRPAASRSIRMMREKKREREETNSSAGV